MTIELHLPDLPEVPVSVGPEPGAPPRPRIAWSERLRQALGTYLPLLLMVALALITWWLVKVAPKTPSTPAETVVRHEADYTLERFTLQRYDKTGRLMAVIEGEQLRHFPDTDELEIDTVRLTLTAPDGRITHATARQALAAGDGSVARLEGDAKVVSQGQGTELPVEMTGQRLVALIHDQQITTDQAVSVRQGNTEFHADALEFDNQTRQLTLHGKFHAVFAKPALKR